MIIVISPIRYATYEHGRGTRGPLACPFCYARTTPASYARHERRRAKAAAPKLDVPRGFQVLDLRGNPVKGRVVVPGASPLYLSGRVG